jgi:hypothetical protein
MKKIYLLISAALLSAGAYAQTLTQANNAMVIGNTYSTKQCDSTGITAGGNGPGQTWNYSTISIHNSTVKNYTAVTVASTGSAAAYPAASVAVSGGPGNNSYYTSNTTDYKYYGGNLNVGGVAAVIGFSTPMAQARYPMSITNSTVSATSGTLLVLGNNGTFTGSHTVTATGTGALQLPGSITYPNTIKVISAQVINFSSIVTGTITAVYYDYFSPANSKAPLFSIQTSSIVSLLGSTTQTYVTINSNYLTLAVKEQQDKEVLGFEVYPNPASENLNITFNNPSNELTSYQIINSLGQLVKSEEINAVSGINKQQISLKNLESGMYFVTITVGDKTAYQKINIQ